MLIKTEIIGEKNQIIIARNKITPKKGRYKMAILKPGDKVTIFPERTRFIRIKGREIMMVGVMPSRATVKDLERFSPIFFVNAGSLKNVPQICLIEAEARQKRGFRKLP